jgi:hypothetical protein
MENIMAELVLGLIVTPVIFVVAVAIDRYFGDW